MCGHADNHADLSDAWVGALDILAGQVQPAGGVRVGGRAVVPQGTPSLTAAPATLELPLCLQTHATAVSLSCTLVQVHCGKQDAEYSKEAADESSEHFSYLRKTDSRLVKNPHRLFLVTHISMHD